MNEIEKAIEQLNARSYAAQLEHTNNINRTTRIEDKVNEFMTKNNITMNRYEVAREVIKMFSPNQINAWLNGEENEATK